MSDKPLDKQVGGDHYKDMKIQPIVFAQANELNACEANIVKYVCRHKQKGRMKDLEKVIHYAQMLIELEYTSNPKYPVDWEAWEKTLQDKVILGEPSKQSPFKASPLKPKYYNIPYPSGSGEFVQLTYGEYWDEFYGKTNEEKIKYLNARLSKSTPKDEDCVEALRDHPDEQSETSGVLSELDLCRLYPQLELPLEPQEPEPPIPEDPLPCLSYEDLLNLWTTQLSYMMDIDTRWRRLNETQLGPVIFVT
jgi:hypothetical protein